MAGNFREPHTHTEFLFDDCHYVHQLHHSVSDIDYSHVYTEQSALCSLRELCVRAIISDAMPRINCLGLPQMFKNLLIQRAILYGNVKCVTALLNAWRHEVFVFEVPVPLRTWMMFIVNHATFIPLILKLSSFVELISQHFITSLNSDSGNQSPIRCLDFSAFPIGGCRLQQICMAIENCRMFPESFKFHENARVAEKMRCLDVQVPSNKCVIKINCILQFKEDINLLFRALNHVRDHNTPLDLVVIGVHVTNLNIPSREVIELLNILEPRALDAFSYSTHFSFDTEDHSDIIRRLSSFPNLRALNLQLDFIDLKQHEKLIIELCDLLHQMENLKHFHLYFQAFDSPPELNTFRIDESVPLRLPFVDVQLECLELIGHCSSARDFMSVFKPVHTLKTLNISCTQFDLRNFVPQLTACKSLRVLVLEDCRFFGGDIDHLFEAFSTMEKLKCLNIDSIHVSAADLLKQALHISRMPSLECLSISSKFEEVLDGGYNFKEEFRCALERLWNCSSRRIVMF